MDPDANAADSRDSGEPVPDHRLNQARWIYGCAMMLRQYRSLPDWKDDHCIACWTKFSETPSPSALDAGFTTYTRWDWLCGNCHEELHDALALKEIPHKIAHSLATGELEIRHAHEHDWIPAIRELFLEYGESIGHQVCLQSFEREVAALPGEYNRAIGQGSLLVALIDGQLAGCVALRKWKDLASEMKRLYVRPNFRGRNVGEALTRAAIDEARRLGYESIRLDTLPGMKSAHRIYESLGFQVVAPHGAKPIPGALHMELVFH